MEGCPRKLQWCTVGLLLWGSIKKVQKMSTEPFFWLKFEPMTHKIQKRSPHPSTNLKFQLMLPVFFRIILKESCGIPH